MSVEEQANFHDFQFSRPSLKMVVVAVAGGTGGVGRTIVETLLHNPRYKTIVLARKVRYPKLSTET
jgi:hypothetical protein